MARYIFSKFVRGLISLFLFLTILFFIAQVLIPGDYVTQFVMQTTGPQREAMREELGLDQPLVLRYVHWLSQMATGSFGTSLSGASVSDILRKVLPPTLLIFVTGAGIALFFGSWLGRWAAWRRRGVVSGSTTFSAVMFYTAFPPWLAFLVFYFFTLRLRWFPIITSGNPFRDLAEIDPTQPPPDSNGVMLLMVLGVVIAIVLTMLITRFASRRLGRSTPTIISVLLWLGIAILSWYALGVGPHSFQILEVAALPMITFVLLTLGDTYLIMMTSMQDVSNEPYIQTARAKGLPDRSVRDRHAARTAFIPVLSRFVVSIPFLLTGIVIVERALNWPGMGETMFSSLYVQDMPVVMATMVIVGLIAFLGRFILDILHAVLDPRVRQSADSGDMQFSSVGL